MKEAVMKSLIHQHIFKFTGQLILDKEFSEFDYMLMREVVPTLHKTRNNKAKVAELLGVVNNIISKHVEEYEPITMEQAEKHFFDTIISLN